MTILLTDDLATAAVDHLSQQTEVKDLLGSDAIFDTWIFRDDLLSVIEGSEQAAIVVTVRGSWTTPNPHNTMRFPRMMIELYQDPPRDAEGQPVQSTVSDLLDHLYKVVDSYLHRPQGGEQTWGDLRVLGCDRASEPEPFDWGDVDHTQVVRIPYNVVVG